MGAPGEELFNLMYTPLPSPDVIFEEGDYLFDSDLQVIHTPGHTPGSVCLFSESHQLLFTGDTLFFEGVGRTDMAGGDADALVSAIREKIFVLDDAVRIFPGHGPFSTLEREKRNNPYVRA